jgi:hypothetical protein
MSSARLLPLLTASLFASAAQASEWLYAGYFKTSGVEAHQFFDAESVSHPTPDLVRVWVKSIQLRFFDRYYKTHEKIVVEKSARKVVSGYLPRFLTLDAVKSQYEASQLKDAAIELTGYEVMANEPDIHASSKLYFEIDCVLQRIKLLDGIVYSDQGGVQKKGGKPDLEYHFIAPDSNGQWLSQLLCPRK